MLNSLRESDAESGVSSSVSLGAQEASAPKALSLRATEAVGGVASA